MDGAGTVMRRLLGFGASAALHALTLAAIAAFTAKAMPLARAVIARVPVVLVHPDASPRDRPPQDLGITVPEQSSTIALPGFEFDYRKVASRAGSLFPFVTGTLSLEMVVAEPRAALGGGLVNRFARTMDVALAKPPLALTGGALQSVIDESWSRRDRWRVFPPVRALAEHYHADRGQLPALLRAYEQQNGLQPYVDTAMRDARLWAELGLAADHEDFIDFISRYATDHPATKARTELLFLLDKIAQASYDALVTLLDAIPDEDLQWTRERNEPAFGAIARIQKFYILELHRRGLGTRDALRRYYDAARISILNTIVESTPNGYRASDARYLIGAILWKQGRVVDAEQFWSAVQIDPTDSYVAEYSKLEAMLRAPDGPRLDARAVNQILDAQRGRWLSFSATRLRRFGYHFDTY
jgi:hypothetical protein